MECTGDDAGVEVEQYLSDISSDMTPLHSYLHFLQPFDECVQKTLS